MIKTGLFIAALWAIQETKTYTMYLYILGKNPDDIGNQLEKLTCSILEKLGYSNIIRNEIGSGGHEIDVRANLKLPTFNGISLRKIICECKAHQRASNMTDWLKFLGKVYVEGIDEDIDGYFIALSGVNGNVSGNYEEIRKKKKNIKLITGEALIENLSSIFDFVGLKVIQNKIANSTSRKPIEISLAYYNVKLYYLIGFSENEFSLLNENAEFLAEKDTNFLSTLIQSNTSYSKFINLEAEQKALIRQDTLNKVVCATYLVENRIFGVDDLLLILKNYKSILPDLEVNEIEFSINQLVEKGLLCNIEDIKKFKLKNFNSENEVDFAISLFRYLLSGIIPIFAIGCENYDNLIDEKLLEAIRNIQEGIIIPIEQQDRCLNIIKLSPSALLWALTPNKIFTNNRSKGKAAYQNVEETHTSMFIQKISNYLFEDYNSQHLVEYFFKKREILEFETNTKYIIKSKNKVELNMDYNERISLGQLTDEYNNIVVHLRVLDGQPEPWE